MQQLQVGDWVKVEEKKEDNFGGWVSPMNEMIGKIYRVVNVELNNKCAFIGEGVYPYSFSLEGLTLCLPERWAIKTDRQEFWDYYKDYKDSKESRLYHHFPAFEYCGDIPCHADYDIHNNYALITYEYWDRVMKSQIQAKSIPEKWCVRRTPENAKVLNAWFLTKWGENFKHILDKKEDMFFDQNQCWGLSLEEEYPEITFEQWKEIPEVKGWLKEWKEKDHDTESILNEDPSKISYKPELRKIVAYKAPFDMFDGAVKKGSIFFKKDTSDNGYRLEGWAKYDIYYLPGELVEKFFEPVYEEEKMTAVKFYEKWYLADWHKDNDFTGIANDFRSDIKKLLEDNK